MRDISCGMERTFSCPAKQCSLQTLLLNEIHKTPSRIAWSIDWLLDIWHSGMPVQCGSKSSSHTTLVANRSIGATQQMRRDGYTVGERRMVCRTLKRMQWIRKAAITRTSLPDIPVNYHRSKTTPSDNFIKYTTGLWFAKSATTLLNLRTTIKTLRPSPSTDTRGPGIFTPANS